MQGSWPVISIPTPLRKAHSYDFLSNRYTSPTLNVTFQCGIILSLARLPSNRWHYPYQVTRGNRARELIKRLSSYAERKSVLLTFSPWLSTEPLEWKTTENIWSSKVSREIKQLGVHSDKKEILTLLIKIPEVLSCYNTMDKTYLNNQHPLIFNISTQISPLPGSSPWPA